MGKNSLISTLQKLEKTKFNSKFVELECEELINFRGSGNSDGDLDVKFMNLQGKRQIRKKMSC